MNFEEVADKQRVYAKIDLKAVRLNMDNMHKNLSDKTKMMAVVKTNGYGFGAVEISNMLEKLDYIWGYATATVEEAFELRENGIKKPILILGYVFPYAYEKMLREDIRPAVFRFDQLEELNECAKKIALEGSVKKKIHIAVDTGMSRIGICPDENGAMFVKKALNMSNLEVEGIFTHFARADEADLTDAHHKKDVFAGFVEKVEKENKIRIPLHHCANSASIIDMPEAQMDMVRAGVTMYGMKPSDDVKVEKIGITPVLSLISHIAFIKDVPENTPVSYGGTFVTDKVTRIATIPVGYGDGYPRSLSNKGYVLIRGQKARILGRVCMDQMMVDISDIHGALEGDKVTLIGQDGEQYISIEELGDMSGRFNYELACDLNHRIPRVYEY
ncbi:alanine racemase [Butyrivibrio sp. NC3005]|uniref:alanine racemase n=1 Tax=Butyrivibrio sp. NC3005 TaxID=1280685 RepID=UPI0004084351|nr:alanine racemase [Butyrivibrio sp. NC3005]